MELEQIIDDFNEKVADYNQIVREVVPYYDAMLKMMVEFMPFSHNESIRVLDLGCGIGNTADAILQTYPNAIIKCVDLAPSALAICADRFRENKNLSFLELDIRERSLYDESFDMVVSNLAIHHIENDDEKITVFRNAYDSLGESGILMIGDHVHGSGTEITRRLETHWMKYMENSGVAQEKREQYYREYIEKDYPASLVFQLEELKKIGFKNVDCMWKYSMFAVFYGEK